MTILLRLRLYSAALIGLLVFALCGFSVQWVSVQIAALYYLLIGLTAGVLIALLLRAVADWRRRPWSERRNPYDRS